MMKKFGCSNWILRYQTSALLFSNPLSSEGGVQVHILASKVKNQRMVVVSWVDGDEKRRQPQFYHQSTNLMLEGPEMKGS
jgi:hypothetical protein